MPAPIDATGQKFGRLYVISKAESRVSASGNRRTMWLCRCDCGRSCEVTISKLKSGWTRSCGCMQAEIASAPKTHGMRMNGKRPKGYCSWAGMKARCQNPKSLKWPLYGGRGIKVCDAWKEFSSFIESMGEPENSSMSIDRIDTNGNYEPGNCRWATPLEQANNTRQTKFITHGLESKSLSQWAEALETTRDAIKLRLRKGQSFQFIHDHFLRRKNQKK